MRVVTYWNSGNLRILVVIQLRNATGLKLFGDPGPPLAQRTIEPPDCGINCRSQSFAHEADNFLA
jgi:hypothetical protein